MGYFTVEVKPTIPASKLQAGTFAAGDTLFPWTAFDVPKGGAKLVGATVLTRPKGDAGPSGNNFGMDILFSKTDTTEFGTVSGAPTNTPSNDLLGVIGITTGHAGHWARAGTSTCVATSSAGGAGQPAAIVFSNLSGQDTISGTEASRVASNVGYDRFYISAMATATTTWVTLNTIAATATASNQVVCDGSGMNLAEHFLPGDVLHCGTTVGAAAADAVIGTVLNLGDTAGADTDTTLTLTAVAATTHVDGTLVQNIHPIRMILHFEN